MNVHEAAWKEMELSEITMVITQTHTDTEFGEILAKVRKPGPYNYLRKFTNRFQIDAKN